MASASQLIDYLRKCYEADNRETVISNLLQSKHRLLRFIEGDEAIISGTLPRVALPPQYALSLRKEAYKYRRDKSLVYAALPIVGRGEAYSGLPDVVCAPLLFLSAGFEEIQGSFFLRPNSDELRINFAALALIAEATGADATALEQALARLPPLPWPRERLHPLAATLAELLPAVDFTSLASFPRLFSAATIQNYTDKPLACLPAASVALLPNSPEARGVLFELSELSNLKHPSPPLRCLIEEEFDKSTGRSRKRWHRPVTPSVLSSAQQQALVASSLHPLTLVVGPPGTGKSHTIASIALDHLSRNQTVLIASRTDQAVDVVAGKIESLIGPSAAIVRAGRKSHLRELKNKLEDLLSGISASGIVAQSTEFNSRTLKRDLWRLDRAINRSEALISSLSRLEIAWGSLEALPASGFVGRLKDSLAKQFCNWQIGDADLWRELECYQSQLNQRQALAQKTLQNLLKERVQRLLRRQRDDLVKFLAAIRARSDSKQQGLFEEIRFDSLLHAFPVWLCKLTDLSHVLPWRRGLFDVVILDEATQCDIASCLPLLHRGKRGVVVGDPKQLRHISFLPETRQSAVAQECQLTAGEQEKFHYRNKSILDAVGDSLSDQSRVSFLNEYFRSLPDIIRFSNSHFYSNSLAIMREQPSTANLCCVHVRRCTGKRDPSGANRIEADQLVADLVQCIEASSVDAPPTIGVISPFRDQVEYLASSLDRSLSFEQMRRHDLLIGTAHTFQGEERDEMYISLAIDDTAHSATMRFLNNPQLLNVAVTRARHLQFLYASFDPQQLDKQSLLSQLMHSVESPMAHRTNTNAPVDAFRTEIARELEKLGLRTWQDFCIASEPIDLIIESSERSLALDLIGYPGQLSTAYPLERYRMLHRAGLDILPLSYRDWRLRRGPVLQRIQEFLKVTQTNR